MTSDDSDRPTGEPRSFWERYRQLFNKRGLHWWAVVFGYPIGRFLVLLLLPFRWITPNVLTLIGFALKIAIAGLIYYDPPHALLLTVIFMQVALILDCMDGTLARLRKSFSAVGAFLDKSTDALGFFLIGAAIGLRAGEQTGEPMWIVAGCGAGAAYLMLCYMYWVVKAVEPQPPTPASILGAAEIPSWADIGREWLRAWRMMFNFEESDLYLWMAILVAVERWTWLVILLVGTQTIGMVYRLIDYTIRLSRMTEPQ